MSGVRSVLAVLVAGVVVLSLLPGGVVGATAGETGADGSGTARLGPASGDIVSGDGSPTARVGPRNGHIVSGDGGAAPQAGVRTVLRAQEATGSLSQSTFRVTRGDAVEISFSHSAPATLYIGDEDAGARIAVNVSGSGSSTVTLHTYNSTSPDPDEYVDGGNATLLYPRGGLSKSLVATSYNLNLTVAGVTQDLGRLVIEERPTATLTSHVAPRSLDRIEADFEDVASTMTTGNRVAKGDYAVIAINATGLGAAINPNDLTGGSVADGIHLQFEDREPEPNVAGDTFSARSASNGVLTYWDEDSDTLLVTWDTSDVSLGGGTHSYNVSLSIEADHNRLLETDSVEDNLTLTVVKQSVSLETAAGQLTVYPWETNAVQLRGSTSFAPGTTLDFRARAFEPRPFLKKEPTTVSENRTFVAEMDLSDVARGLQFPLWVQGHRDLGEWQIATKAANASFDFHNQTAPDGRIARLDNVSLSVGGFIVLENRTGVRIGVSQRLNETVNGTRNVSLSPPLERSSYVRATAVMDWNENGTYEPGLDRAYARNGTNVTQLAVVFVPETGGPRPPTAVNNSTSTTTNRTTTNTTTGPTTSTVTTLSVQSQDPLTPGGSSGNAGLSLAVPVVAILSLALLARRRGGG